MFAQIGYYICVPFAWITRLFYSVTGSYGVALILFTLVVKLVILPFQTKSKKSMLRMNRMQGKIKDIQTRFANNKQRQQEEMNELYAREGVNPMAGCLWSFLPFPILIALYYIIRTPLRFFMNMSETAIAKVTELAQSLGYMAAETAQNKAYEQIYLAKFIHENWASFAGKFDRLIDLDYQFIGIDLANQPKDVLSQFPGGGWAVWGLLLLPFIAAALQLLMSKFSMSASSNTMNGSNKVMMYMFPLMTVWMGFMFPAALCVYWIANAGFSAIQEYALNKYYSKKLDAEETDKEREKREKRIAKMEAARANYGHQQEDRGAKSPTATSKKKQQGQKEQKDADKRPGTNENGRVGQRPYARGRAYQETHYDE